MSFKAKNLTVNSEEPAFLKKLRGEVGESAGNHPQPVARPRQKRPLGDEDDDAPTYVVDETTNETLTKSEVEKLKGEPTGNDDVSAESSTQPNPHVTDDSHPGSGSKKENVGQIGAASKRRVAKIVGDDPPAEPSSTHDEKPKKRKKTEKKAKVKLSFEEE